MTVLRYLSKENSGMSFELSNCTVRTPVTGAEKKLLYRMLAEVFPVEQELFQQLENGSKHLYNWTPHTLFHLGEPVGNISTVKFTLRSGSGFQETCGFASVATVPHCRGKGVAGFLIKIVLQKTDLENLPSILFTSLPQVYEGSGFKLIPQNLLQTDVKKIDLKHDFQMRTIETITNETVQKLSDIYEISENAICRDGALRRDAPYWNIYRDFFNQGSKTRIILCLKNDDICGYARIEYETGRILLSELNVSNPRAGYPFHAHEAHTAIWNEVCSAADKKNVRRISIALPEGHELQKVLTHNDFPLVSETDARREVFMIRQPVDKHISWLDTLHWPLSDKF